MQRIKDETRRSAAMLNVRLPIPTCRRQIERIPRSNEFDLLGTERIAPVPALDQVIDMIGRAETLLGAAYGPGEYGFVRLAFHCSSLTGVGCAH